MRQTETQIGQLAKNESIAIMMIVCFYFMTYWCPTLLKFVITELCFLQHLFFLYFKCLTYTCLKQFKRRVSCSLPKLTFLRFQN